MKYSTLQLAQLYSIYIDKICTDPTTRYTMRISSFIEWLNKEDQTKLLKHEICNTNR